MDAMRRPSAEAKPVAVEEPGQTLEIVSERGAFRKVQMSWLNVSMRIVSQDRFEFVHSATGPTGMVRK
jgi:hypothetical protein